MDVANEHAKERSLMSQMQTVPGANVADKPLSAGGDQQEETTVVIPKSAREKLDRAGCRGGGSR